MTLNDVIPIILRYFNEFGRFTGQYVTVVEVIYTDTVCNLVFGSRPLYD